MRDLSSLQEELAGAKHELACADIGIENAQRRRAEMTHWQGRIDALERLIAEHDGFNPYGSGPVPIEPRETLMAALANDEGCEEAGP